MKYINIFNDESIVFLTVNRPKELNALNSDVLHEIEDAIKCIDYEVARINEN